MNLICLYQNQERTTGKGILKFGTIEDFSVPGLTGEDKDFGFAFMRTQGKSKPSIISAFSVRDAVRVVFDKNPGSDTFLIYLSL